MPTRWHARLARVSVGLLPLCLFAQSSFIESSVPSQSASGQQVNRAQDQARQLAAQTLATFIRDHDAAKAEEGFRHVTQVDPGYVPAWFNLGVFAERDEHWSDARNDFAEYLRLAPDGRDATRAKSELQLLERYSKGGIDSGLARRAEYDAMIQRARGFLAAGLFRESIAEAGRAQAADKSRWESYAVVSLCALRQHKLVEAAKMRDRAVALAPADKREQIRAALSQESAMQTRQ